MRYARRVDVTRDSISYRGCIMNINKELGFAECFARSVRLFAHPRPAIDKQREDNKGHRQNG